MSASLAFSSLPASRFFVTPMSQEDAPPHKESLAVDSSALLQGNKTVAIVHNGSIYRLQATKLGKLILTK